jgi:glycosyltransferase involved in cell wall biosynthesis
MGLPPRGRVAGWVGRHFAQKRPEVVVEVARRIVVEVPDASFLMVGDGPTFDDAVTKTAGEERIHVLGYRDDIETAYAAMDVFMLASAWEGLPRTVLEAGAAGVPVVAPGVSGIGEIVRDGETGRLLESGSSVTLADALIRLLSDHGEMRRMGRNIQAVIDDEYSARHMTEAIAALYSDVYEQRRTRAVLHSGDERHVRR